MTLGSGTATRPERALPAHPLDGSPGTGPTGYTPAVRPDRGRLPGTQTEAEGSLVHITRHNTVRRGIQHYTWVRPPTGERDNRGRGSGAQSAERHRGDRSFIREEGDVARGPFLTKNQGRPGRRPEHYTVLTPSCFPWKLLLTSGEFLHFSFRISEDGCHHASLARSPGRYSVTHATGTAVAPNRREQDTNSRIKCVSYAGECDRECRITLSKQKLNVEAAWVRCAASKLYVMLSLGTVS